MGVMKELVGIDWLEKHNRHWKQYAWNHPIISTYHFAESVLDKDESIIAGNEHAIRLIFWVANLSNVLSRLESNNLRMWLRDPKECLKHLYMIEIVNLCLAQGYEIEFNDRPPYGYDFHVVFPECNIPIECKKKGKTQRDQIAQTNWEELERRLNQVMDKKRKSGFIWMESASDLTSEDITFIESFVGKVFDQVGDSVQGYKDLFCAVGPSAGVHGTMPVEDQQLLPDDKFFFLFQELHPSDEIQHGSFNMVGIYPNNPSWGKGTVEKPIKSQDNIAIGPAWKGIPQYLNLRCHWQPKAGEISNFRAFGFKSQEKRDYVTTVVNSLADVRKHKQLPPDGPGLIFIEMAPPPVFSAEGGNFLKLRFDEINAEVSPKLRGEQNRRINAIILTCTMPARIDHSKDLGIGVSCRVIRHENPKTALPNSFKLLDNIQVLETI